MKKISHIGQNRPVHLALRDVYYEQAAERLTTLKKGSSHEVEIQSCEEILYLLRVARRHAHFSIRFAGENEKDEQFYKFIRLLAGNMKAVLSMLSLKNTVEDSEGFFLSFLEVHHALVAFQAAEYERRVVEILQALHKILDLANIAHEKLKYENMETLSARECKRYNKAAAHHRAVIMDLPEIPEYKKRTGLLA